MAKSCNKKASNVFSFESADDQSERKKAKRTRKWQVIHQVAVLVLALIDVSKCNCYTAKREWQIMEKARCVENCLDCNSQVINTDEMMSTGKFHVNKMSLMRT